MKIKTQFHLLIAGIVLLPVLVLAAERLVFQLRNPPSDDAPPFARMMPGPLGPRPDDGGPRPADGGPRPDDGGPRPDAAGPRPADGGPRPEWRGPAGRGPWRMPNPWVIITQLVLVVVGLIFVFVLIMSFVILRSINKEVIDAQNALKEEERRKNRFIMGVTHDLKTPLALIKGYACAIEDGVTEDPQSRKHSLEIIRTKVDQLGAMIDDLLSFVRINSGEWRKTLSPVNLREFLYAYAERVRSDAELLERRIETSINLPLGLQVPMDSSLFLRALENLVNNALRYTPPGSVVRISSRLERAAKESAAGGPPAKGAAKEKSRQTVIIEVSDNGPGLSPADLPHVFETFYRGTTSRREAGMGLGLAVVKGVCDTHGWEVSAANNRLGGGSVFSIRIPLPPALTSSS